MSSPLLQLVGAIPIRVCVCVLVFMCMCVAYTRYLPASTHASVARGARFVSIAPAAGAPEAARESCAAPLVRFDYHIV